MTSLLGSGDVRAAERDAGPVHGSLCLDRAAHYVSASVTAVLRRENVTLEQWRVLDELSRLGGLSMSAIATNVIVTGPTLTRVVDRLASEALVFRATDELDRRRVLVHISDRGRRLRDRLAPLVANAEAEAMSALLPDEASLLHSLIDRIGAAELAQGT